MQQVKEIALSKVRLKRQLALRNEAKLRGYLREASIVQDFVICLVERPM